MSSEQSGLPKIAELSTSPVRSYSFIQKGVSDDKLPMTRAPSMRFNREDSVAVHEQLVSPIKPQVCPPAVSHTLEQSSNGVFDYQLLQDCKYGSSRDYASRAGSIIVSTSRSIKGSI